MDAAIDAAKAAEEEEEEEAANAGKEPLSRRHAAASALEQ